MSFFNETEPNDTAATANALPGSQVAVYGTISPAIEVDFFSFTANAGDRVYAATQTQWSNGGSTDTILDVYASDGTTVLETDDDSGSFSGTASAIGGTIIPAAGTYYIRVDGFSYDVDHHPLLPARAGAERDAYRRGRAEQRLGHGHSSGGLAMDERHDHGDDRPGFLLVQPERRGLRCSSAWTWTPAACPATPTGTADWASASSPATRSSSPTTAAQ